MRPSIAGDRSHAHGASRAGQITAQLRTSGTGSCASRREDLHSASLLEVSVESDQEPAGPAVLAERLIRAISIALAVVAITLAAALAFDWTPVLGPSHELAPDPAANLPF